MNTCFTFRKDPALKWLLAVTMLFSIFTVSGYAGNAGPKQQQATQTELVLSSFHKAAGRTISYKRALGLLYATVPAIHPGSNWKNTLFACNLLGKVKLDRISGQYRASTPGISPAQVKTIPQSSDEDVTALFIG